MRGVDEDDDDTSIECGTMLSIRWNSARRDRYLAEHGYGLPSSLVEYTPQV